MSTSAAAMLDAWEDASAHPAWARPLVLLAAADGGDAAALAALPLGARDTRLARLRTTLFGPATDALAACPACGEAAELRLPLGELFPDRDEAPSCGVVEVAGAPVAFRLPTTADLGALGDGGAAELAARCLIDGRSPSAEVVAALEEAMAALDPAGDVVLSLRCPGCGEAFDAPFDLAGFLWEELCAWAERLFGEIDVLARAYGWAESEVLALRPARRHRYLELAAR